MGHRQSDLGELWPSLSGRLSAHGKLSGPRMQPQVTVDARGELWRSWARRSASSH